MTEVLKEIKKLKETQMHQTIELKRITALLEGLTGNNYQQPSINASEQLKTVTEPLKTDALIHFKERNAIERIELTGLIPRVDRTDYAFIRIMEKGLEELGNNTYNEILDSAMAMKQAGTLVNAVGFLISEVKAKSNLQEQEV